MVEQARKEFGRRRPQRLAPKEPPPKRSSHVALLLMGTLAVGGTAYTLMPSETCTPPPSPGIAQPGQPQTSATTCSFTGSSGGHGHASRYSFLGGGDSGSRPSSGGGSSEALSGAVTRGGFGSLAHAFGISGSS